MTRQELKLRIHKLRKPGYDSARKAERAIAKAAGVTGPMLPESEKRRETRGTIRPGPGARSKRVTSGNIGPNLTGRCRGCGCDFGDKTEGCQVCYMRHYQYDRRIRNGGA